jgi:uncharacterized protein (DUF952 family)
MESAMIYHICTRNAWQTAQRNGHYTTDSLPVEGFIHCSTAAQLLVPANALYHGRTDLILLCIDDERVHGRLVYEDCYESGTKFPHIYAPLNLDAVTDVVDFPPNIDGSFSLPPALT